MEVSGQLQAPTASDITNVMSYRVILIISCAVSFSGSPRFFSWPEDLMLCLRLFVVSSSYREILEQ
jgi:hypothetical protein